MSADRSLDAGYFDGIFASTDDPWSLASSDYERAKFAHSADVLGDRRYDHALEIGCAHGVLTGHIAPMCEDMLAIDIADAAIEAAKRRCRDLPQIRFERVAFPSETPSIDAVDLVLLSEVVYYWSDGDITAAGGWLKAHVSEGGRILLVHYTQATDYPQTGDGATEKLRAALGGAVVVALAERRERYRLDLWTRA